MNRSQLRFAALSLAIVFTIAACKPAGQDGAAPAADANAPLPGAAAPAGDKVTAQITGAGATFIYPLLSKWSDDYNKDTGHHINYQSIGSGGGIAQIKAGTVDFGSTDKPLPPEELAEAGLGAVSVGDRRRGAGRQPRWRRAGRDEVHRPAAGRHLSSARSRRGTIQRSPRSIRTSSYPRGKINVVHRSDGSGTTFNFVNYLSKVSPEWKSKVGEGTSVSWPTGIGGKGNEGVAAYTQADQRRSIGYVELSYALQNKMSYAAVKNTAGKFVRAECREFPGRRRQRRLDQREGLPPDHDQCAGRERVADRRDQLHPDVQAAEGR